MDEEVPPTIPMRAEWDDDFLPTTPGEQNLTCILNALSHFQWVLQDWASVLRKQQTVLAAQFKEQSAAALERMERLLMRQPSEPSDPWRSQGRAMRAGAKSATTGKKLQKQASQ